MLEYALGAVQVERFAAGVEPDGRLANQLGRGRRGGVDGLIQGCSCRARPEKRLRTRTNGDQRRSGGIKYFSILQENAVNAASRVPPR